MKHATQMQFGRPAKAVLPSTSDITDKWQALNALSEAAETYDLSHRTLGVLKALMTFLPGRIIHPEPGQAIVFPSNRTLSHRLNGMPNSTLRRHLAHLVRLGIVTRFDSPNRKRFARGAGRTGIAFGFDLSPLARHHSTVQDAAQAARQACADLQTMRAKLGALRYALLEAAGQSSLTEDARRALKRKPDMTEMTALCQHINLALEPSNASPDSKEMSTPGAQNERHIHTDNQYISDSEEPGSIQFKEKKEAPCGDTKHRNNIMINDVLSQCKEYKSYFPEPVRGWHDLINIAERLTKMIGIDAPVFREAAAVMRPERAAIVVICMLENLSTLNNPGGYLRRLTQTARAGRFDVKPMLDAVANRRELSADNQNLCSITMSCV